MAVIWTIKAIKVFMPCGQSFPASNGKRGNWSCISRYLCRHPGTTFIERQPDAATEGRE